MTEGGQTKEKLTGDRARDTEPQPEIQDQNSESHRQKLRKWIRRRMEQGKEAAQRHRENDERTRQRKNEGKQGRPTTQNSGGVQMSGDTFKGAPSISLERHPQPKERGEAMGTEGEARIDGSMRDQWEDTTSTNSDITTRTDPNMRKRSDEVQDRNSRNRKHGEKRNDDETQHNTVPRHGNENGPSDDEQAGKTAKRRGGNENTKAKGTLRQVGRRTMRREENEGAETERALNPASQCKELRQQRAGPRQSSPSRRHSQKTAAAGIAATTWGNDAQTSWRPSDG
jgi:hypothetical protein